MIDLLIRGGQLVDGEGGEPVVGDLAINGDRIVEVGGRSSHTARRVLDADGALVTPGFVDIHTHYDAQVHWDPLVSPSSEHGVTTVVVGNCGLGLAPVHPGDQKTLQALLGGVEDIPQRSLDAGLQWTWQRYAEYMAAIDAMPRSVEVATLVGHAALRLHAMGPERAYREAARADEIAAMQRLLGEAFDAGALGFSTSRSRLDRDFEGRSTPSCFAEDRETEALAKVLADRGQGVIELAFRGSAGDEPERFESELDWMRDLAAASRRPVTFGLAQLDAIPDRWQRAHEVAGRARASGVELRPQTLGRMQSVLVGLEAVHPFANRPSYRPLAALPLGDRLRRLRDRNTRARILAEPSGPPSDDDPFSGLFSYDANRIFILEAVPDYEPGPEKSLASVARFRGVEPMSLLYDLILEDEGRRLLLYAVANYHGGDHAATKASCCAPRAPALAAAASIKLAHSFPTQRQPTPTPAPTPTPTPPT